MNPFETKITALKSVCMITKSINTDLEAKDAEYFNVRTFS